ncbi:hypothetical protein ACLI09_15575 [Flavobacterium sp. RHBU_24]
MEIQLKTYTARLCHDIGTVTLSTVAKSPEQAITQIAAAEGCPTHAVVLV